MIDVALQEAKKAFDEGKVDLMDKLNQEILRLANEFGALGLESIELGSDAKMAVRKGNQKSAFSRLTPGERLRLRIATAIAVVTRRPESGRWAPPWPADRRLTRLRGNQ